VLPCSVLPLIVPDTSTVNLIKKIGMTNSWKPVLFRQEMYTKVLSTDEKVDKI
jgi:hypothetical protein